jgi:hypothetical protein
MKQQVLFGCGWPPRPNRTDPEVLERLLDALMPRVIQWMKSAGDDTDKFEKSYLKEIHDDLRSAVRFDDDAYDIAKMLDNIHYWEVDHELLHLLEDVAYMRIKAHNSLIAEWVNHHGVTPKYSVGQRVTFKHRGKDQVGEVSKVEEQLAQYVVFCESLGHVRKGVGSHGLYVNYENVQDAPELNTPIPTV